jgi:hypothetical protein
MMDLRCRTICGDDRIEGGLRNLRSLLAWPQCPFKCAIVAYPSGAANFVLGFTQLLLTKVGVLLVAAAISLCFLVFAPIGRQHQGLDERAMLAAMFAAGGMPLVYAPPALCRAPKQ